MPEAPGAASGGAQRLAFLKLHLQGGLENELRDAVASSEPSFLVGRIEEDDGDFAAVVGINDADALRRQLLQLADLGFLDQDNCRAAVDLLLRSRLTEATAFLLDYCNRRWPRETAGADTDFLDAEFAL